MKPSRWQARTNSFTTWEFAAWTNMIQRVPSLPRKEEQMTITSNQIIRSSRKTMALIVQRDGSLVVRAPFRASEKSIREFVEKNRQWIEKKQAEALAMLPPAPRQYVTGETFLYLGTMYPLEIVKDQKKDLLFDQSFKLAESARGRAVLAFEGWYRAQAR